MPFLSLLIRFLAPIISPGALPFCEIISIASESSYLICKLFAGTVTYFSGRYNKEQNLLIKMLICRSCV